MHFPTLISAQIFFCFLFIMSASAFASAYDLLDTNGSINIKWDIMSWTPDGYVATVTISNGQMYKQITSPGWTLGWTWAKKEVIWSTVGAEATDQGDFSRFKGNNIPHSCDKSPAIVDLLPEASQDQPFPGCCQGGVLSSLVQQDQAAAVSSFQITVGHSGTSKKTVKLPKDFYFLGPGQGYTCSAAMVVPSSVFFSPNGRRKTRAMTCSCGCPNIDYCYTGDSKMSTNTKSSLLMNGNVQLLQCTKHVCPIQVHWHVKMNYRKYWRVKITITNFDYQMKYPYWNIVVQHPKISTISPKFIT